MRRARLADESGSIAPLAVGLATVLIAVSFVFADASSLLLFQQRQTQRAEAMALAVDSALTPPQLSDEMLVQQQAQIFASEAKIADFEVFVTDGRTVTARVCEYFVAPIEVPLAGLQGAKLVCAQAKARKF